MSEIHLASHTWSPALRSECLMDFDTWKNINKFTSRADDTGWELNWNDSILRFSSSLKSNSELILMIQVCCKQVAFSLFCYAQLDSSTTDTSPLILPQRRSTVVEWLTINASYPWSRDLFIWCFAGTILHITNPPTW